jgi:hypothetical protein
MTETNYTTDNGVSVGILLHSLVHLLIYLIGTVIQVRLIYVSYEEKDKCWKIDVAHSVVLITHFTFSILFKTIMYFIPLLSQHVGSWVCYVASFIKFYCFYSIVAHSLVISVIKYLYIVHNQKVRKWNETTLEYCIFIINILHPLFVMIPYTAVLYSEDYLHSCFVKIGFLCVFQNSEDKDAFYIFKRCLCFIGRIVNILINSNIIEGYLYFKIFRKMRR